MYGNRSDYIQAVLPELAKLDVITDIANSKERNSRELPAESGTL